MWRLLRAAVPVADNDLFLAADTHQRIYRNWVSLKQVGIAIAEGSERMTVNYRPTADILGWSFALLRGQRIDDMNENLDTLAGCRSDVHGKPPSLHPAPTRERERSDLVADVRGWLAGGVAPGQIGIAVRSGSLVDAAVAALRAAGMPAVSLARSAPSEDAIAVATMHRMKGLEFRNVAVIGLSAALVPPPWAVTPAAEDPATHELDLQQERCVLYVACTRARETLRVSWHGTPSALLPDDRVARRSESRAATRSRRFGPQGRADPM